MRTKRHALCLLLCVSLALCSCAAPAGLTGVATTTPEHSAPPVTAAPSAAPADTAPAPATATPAPAAAAEPAVEITDEPSPPTDIPPGLAETVPIPSPTPHAAAAPSESPVSPAGSAEPLPAAATVSVTVYGLEREVLLGPADIAYEDGDKCIDALRRAGRELDVSVVVTGSGATAYVRSIAGLEEYDHGALSGWVYTLNGVYATKGAGSSAISPGDTLEFYYTLDMGRDIAGG